MFKVLLLSVWYDLSDMKLAEALDDRASLPRFCGFSASEATSERTAFVRYRKALVAHALDRVPFGAVTAPLKVKAIEIKMGTLVDATIIASASEADAEGRWVKQKDRPAVRGFKSPWPACSGRSITKVACSSASSRGSLHRRFYRHHRQFSEPRHHHFQFLFDAGAERHGDGSDRCRPTAARKTRQHRIHGDMATETRLSKK